MCFSLNLLGFLNAFFLLSSILWLDLMDRCVMSPALFFRGSAERQPVLSCWWFSDVPCCAASLSQQKTFTVCISEPENITASMRCECSSKLSRGNVCVCAYVCVDLLMGFTGFQQRGRDVS